MQNESKMIVYLAGPINGCTDAECRDWREQVKNELPDIHFLDPMRRDYRNLETVENARDIVEDDKQDVEISDVILVYHDRPSVGTSMEILYAFERGIYVLTINATEKPLSPWIIYHSSCIVPSIDKAIEVLQDIQPQFNVEEISAWGDEII